MRQKKSGYIIACTHKYIEDKDKEYVKPYFLYSMGNENGGKGEKMKCESWTKRIEIAMLFNDEKSCHKFIKDNDLFVPVYPYCNKPEPVKVKLRTEVVIDRIA